SPISPRTRLTSSIDRMRPGWREDRSLTPALTHGPPASGSIWQRIDALRRAGKSVPPSCDASGVCGRYTLTDPDPRLLRFRFGLTEEAEIEQEPRYNVAPTDSVLAIRLNEDGRREPGVLRWGLIPHYADPDGFDRLLINARAETIAEAPAFRAAFH